MAYTLVNKSSKDLCKRTVLVQLIIENVVTFFEAQCILHTARVQGRRSLLMAQTWQTPPWPTSRGAGGCSPPAFL